MTMRTICEFEHQGFVDPRFLADEEFRSEIPWLDHSVWSRPGVVHGLGLDFYRGDRVY